MVAGMTVLMGLIALLATALASCGAAVVYGVKAIRGARESGAGGHRTPWRRANEVSRSAQPSPRSIAYRRKSLRAVGLLAASLGTFLLVSGAIVVSDIRDDRRHSITLSEGMLLFSEPRMDCGRSDPRPVAFAPAGERLPVQRIRYGKDCMTVRISTPSGESGWLLADHSVSLSKP